MKKIRLLAILAVIGFCFSMLTGCATLEKNEDDYDEKPWTGRESWENDFGIPF